MPDLSETIELLGTPAVLLAAGLAVGLLFGAAAQQSAFCLRSASVAFWRGQFGQSMAIWLMAFFAALLGVQILVATETLPLTDVRQLASAGTLSGAVIGGLMFGCGMILARGCASRLLVLSATGNLRALLTGLVLTVVAQASLSGVLSPIRLHISQWWIIPPETRSLLLAIPTWLVFMAAVMGLAAGIWLALQSRLSAYRGIMAALVGVAVAAGWGLTSLVAATSFDIVAIQSVSFTGPSADTLMALIQKPTLPMSFDSGLVPGVFAGSMIAAALSRQFKVQVFDGSVSLTRYMCGAALMGFGGMLAGGCAVGAGVTGGSVLALTAWISLFAMWLAAGITDALVDRHVSEGHAGEGHASHEGAAAMAHPNADIAKSAHAGGAAPAAATAMAADR